MDSIFATSGSTVFAFELGLATLGFAFSATTGLAAAGLATTGLATAGLVTTGLGLATSGALTGFGSETGLCLATFSGTGFGIGFEGCLLSGFGFFFLGRFASTLMAALATAFSFFLDFFFGAQVAVLALRV